MAAPGQLQNYFIDLLVELCCIIVEALFHVLYFNMVRINLLTGKLDEICLRGHCKGCFIVKFCCLQSDLECLKPQNRIKMYNGGKV